MTETEVNNAFYHLAAHESVLSTMQKYLLAGDDSIPSAIVVEPTGEGIPMAKFFIEPGDKEAFSAQIKAEVAARKAICAAFAAECWMTITSSEAPDLSPPSLSPDRVEVISVHSEARDGLVLDSIFEIKRGADGKVAGFEKLVRSRSQRGDHPTSDGERGLFRQFFAADA